MPDEWKFGQRQDPATLHYCVDDRDPDFPLARQIGAAIAGALLLQGREHIIGGDQGGEDTDDIYRVLIETCDVFLGFKLIPDAYPEWLRVTRPYYRASYLVVVKDPDLHTLADLPKTQSIGATIGTAADLRLIQYLVATGFSGGWSRVPLGSDEATLDELAKGTIGAALIWGPSLWSLQKDHPAYVGFRTIAPDPLPLSTADVGAALLANQDFLRTNIDQAITSLNGDGSLRALLDAAHFPAAVVP